METICPDPFIPGISLSGSYEPESTKFRVSFWVRSWRVRLYIWELTLLFWALLPLMLRPCHSSSLLRTQKGHLFRSDSHSLNTCETR